MVTLPKAWAEGIGLEAGTEVNMVSIKPNTMVMQPQTRLEKEDKVGELAIGEKQGDALTRSIISLYIAGYEVIKIEGEQITSEQRGTIRRTTQSLIGPEIVEESSDQIIIRNLSDLSELSINETLSRIYQISRTMFEDTIEAMLEVDRALGRLIEGLEQLELYGEVNILITSDHGMQTVDLDRYILLDEFLNLGKVNVSDWGPAAQIWTVDGGPSADEILAAIDTDHPGIRRAWKKGNAPERFHFDDHPRIPDVTIEAELGWMISNKPYYAGMQRGLLNGMHGWDPAWHTMHGIFIATGPAFEPGERLPAVRSVDLYSLMARLMNVPPAETDGSITAFAPLLESVEPMSVSEQQWQCGEELFVIRLSPGLAALHHGGLVFSLPQTESASGARYVDSNVEFWNKGDRARVTINGRAFEECTKAWARDAD